jgi:hypothetical protein
MEHRLLLCVSPGRTRAFILCLLSADRNESSLPHTLLITSRLLSVGRPMANGSPIPTTKMAGPADFPSASIPLMYRNGLNSLFFARRLPTGTIQRVELYRDRVATTRSANQHRPRWTFASLAGPDYPWRFEPLANSCLNPGSRSSMKPLNLVVATPTKAPFKAFQVPTL